MATASQPRPDLSAHREALRLPATAVITKMVEIVGCKHNRGYGMGLDNLNGKKPCRAGRIMRDRRRCCRG